MKYNVTASTLETSTLIDLKANPRSLINWLPDGYINLPEKPNTSKANDDSELYWIGPDHWLLRSHINNENALTSTLNLEAAPTDISAVIVSDMMTFIKLSGVDADQVISILCPIDIHANQFPQNGVSFTEAFGLKALLIRRENGYELAVDRSFTEMIKDVLQRSGAIFD